MNTPILLVCLTVCFQVLAPEAAFAQSGAMETLDDYRAHHLPADIEIA